jgi:hypothetical protein
MSQRSAVVLVSVVAYATALACSGGDGDGGDACRDDPSGCTRCSAEDPCHPDFVCNDDGVCVSITR